MRAFRLIVGLVLGLTATVTAVVVLLASTSPASVPTRPPGIADTAVAARLGAQTITMDQLDRRWREANPAQYSELMQGLYDGRRAALRSVVSEMLIDTAAASSGLSVAQYVDAELGRRVRPVSDDDVLAFYAANADGFDGVALDDLGPRIRAALEDRERDRARARLLADLLKAGPVFTQFFDAPRLATPVTDDDPALGEPDAPVTIVAFSDFECPFCARVEPTLKAIRGTYGDRVRIVWKAFPLTSIHPAAFKAAEAGYCAAEQHGYWAYHDRLFAHQEALAEPDLKAHAAAVGLDPAVFGSCLDSSRHAARVQESLDAGMRLGVQATPTLFINGRVLHGAQPFEAFARVIDEELDWTLAGG